MPYVSSPVRPVGFEVWSPEDGMLPAQVVLPTPAGPAALRRPLVEANRAWLTRMGVCRPGDRTSRALDLASFEDLAALVFRDDTEEHLLLATQLLTIVYLLDDQVDSPRSPVGSDPHAGRAVCDAVLAALAGQLNAMALVPPAVRSPAVRALIRAFSDVGRRLAALPGDRDPFLEAIAVWLDGVAAECAGRASSPVADLAAYAELRLGAGGVVPFFELGCLLRDLAVSPRARRDAQLDRLLRSAGLAAAYANDLVSAGKDGLEGETANLVLVIERVEGARRDQAIARACALHNEVVDEVVDARVRLARRGDPALDAWVDFIIGSMWGHLEWLHRVTARYAGAEEPSLRQVS